MSGALIASMNVGPASSVVFAGAMFVSNGNDTATSPTTYTVPSFTAIGDVVLFYCLSNAQGNSSVPPGNGWTNTNGALPGSSVVYVKRMATSGDLTASINSGGGYIAFAVYRGAVSFAVVSATGFNRSQYHAGATFFGSAKPAPATTRFTLNSNTTTGIGSDMLPPLNYVNGTNYGQYTAVEFRSQ